MGVNTNKKFVYYLGMKTNGWLGRHLFLISYNSRSDTTLDGSTSECLTASIPGHHKCVLDVKARLFVNTFTAITQIPVVTV